MKRKRLVIFFEALSIDTCQTVIVSEVLYCLSGLCVPFTSEKKEKKMGLEFQTHWELIIHDLLMDSMWPLTGIVGSTSFLCWEQDET